MSKNMLKLFAAILVISLLFIAACATAPKTVPESSGGASSISEKVTAPIVQDNIDKLVGAPDAGIPNAAETQIETQKESTSSASSTESSSQTSVASGANVKEISMTAKAWAFEPSTIELNKGDKVKLTVTANDVKHGISIFGISKRLEPNMPEVIEFTADEAGEFPFFCTVYCGDGHGSMKGKVIVR